MKIEVNVQNNKLKLNWENQNADFYKVYLKVNSVYCEAATVYDTFTTISMLPVGDNECYVAAIKNGVVISQTPNVYFSSPTPDGVCYTKDDKIVLLCSSQIGADGYRLYRAVDENGFNGAQNSKQNGLTIDFEEGAAYKLKPYNFQNNERNILSSTGVLAVDDNKFEFISCYKSYGEKLFLSWIYKGFADGFRVYQEGSEYPVFETNDGLCHQMYLNNYQDGVKFRVCAFINTPNGKVEIAESEYVSRMERSYEKPVVSVIIPAYNAQDYISRCIDSALASNFNDLEIIVVNDGSSDGTQGIIDWYVQNYPNVVSFQKENGGVAHTRNYGIERARGEYIAFLDNDDMVRPNMLSSLYSSITKNSCDIAIAPLYRLVDKGYTTHCNLPFEEDKAIDINEYFNILYTPGFYNCAIWNKLYKADMVKAHPLGILKYEDVSWTPCILSYAKTFCFIKTPFYEWDRKTRPETFGDVLARMSDEDLLEHRRQAMMFFVENGNPEMTQTLKTIAKRRLMRYSKNANHNGYEKLIEQLS